MSEDKKMSEDKESVDRVVKGGATMFPVEAPRPPPLKTSTVVLNTMKCILRRATICSLITKLLYPSYRKWFAAHLARGGTEATAFSSQINAIHTSIYLGMFAFFEFCDRTGFLNEYHLARTPSQIPTVQMKFRTLAEFAFNTLVNLYMARFIYPVFQYFGVPSGNSDLPPMWRLICNFAMGDVFNNFTFAILHRLFHHGPFYRMFHKKHHQYVGTISIASENSHPVENVSANLFSTLGGIVFSGAHPLAISVYIMDRLEKTYETHSGYCFYGTKLHSIGLTNSEGCAYHDHHHVLNRGNFGEEFMDHFMGTHDHWIKIGGVEGYVQMSREQKKKN